MRAVVFRLDIDETEYLRYYRGVAQAVIVRAHDGRRVQFPASNLRPFVTNKGIHGQFVLRFDDRNKLLDLTRISA